MRPVPSPSHCTHTAPSLPSVPPPKASARETGGRARVAWPSSHRPPNSSLLKQDGPESPDTFPWPSGDRRTRCEGVDCLVNPPGAGARGADFTVTRRRAARGGGQRPPRPCPPCRAGLAGPRVQGRRGPAASGEAQVPPGRWLPGRAVARPTMRAAGWLAGSARR